MSSPELKARLAAELKQNPQQFALLGIGLVVALVIWAPRLKNLMGANDESPVTPAVPVEDPTSTTAPATASVLDTHAMLDEFRDISNEAQELSRFVLPIVAPRAPRNPFHDEALERANLDAQRQAQSNAQPKPVASEAPSVPEPDLVDHDAESVAKLKLSGVFLFGSERSALIDGELRRVGDVIGTLRVKQIEGRSVLLSGARGEYRLTMKDALEPLTPSAKKDES
jgi:hypothetical protein